MPASMIASAQGGVRPWCGQGSSVTYMVAPRARSPACRRATTSACGPGGGRRAPPPRRSDAPPPRRPEAAARNADGTPFDLDGYNDAQVAERRDWPLERILEEAAGNRAALIEALERLTGGG